MLNYPNADLCSHSIIEAFASYENDRIPPSDFTRACLENKLLESFLYADDTNRINLAHIVAWLYRYMPSDIWGSPEKVNNHLTKQ